MSDSSDDIRFKLPRPRKIVLTIICSTTFINTVLLCVTLVRPIPTFSSTATLLTIEAADSTTFSKRWLVDPDLGAPLVPDLVYASALDPQDYIPLRNGSSLVVALRLDRRGDEAEDDEAYDGDSQDDDDCWPCEATPEESDKDRTLTEYITRTPGPHETAYTTRVKKVVETRMGDVVTRTASAEPPTETAEPSTSTADASEVDMNAFVALWIGPLGIAMQRASGDLLGSSASFTPSFGPSYEQAGLRANVVAKLPKNTGGSSVGLLLAILSYAMCLLLYGFTLTPASWVWTPYGTRRSLDTRHQLTFTLTTLFSVIAMLCVVIPTVMLRNQFSKVEKALPALDANLTAKLGDGFRQLYAVCILAALVLLESLLLIIEDLHFPWWYQGSVQTQMNAWQGIAPALNFTAGPAYVDQETGQFAASRQQMGPASQAGAFQYTPRML